MSNVLEEYTREDQCSIVRFLWARGLNSKNIHTEISPVYGGKCLSRKAVHNWIDKFSQGRSKVTDDEEEARKWLRQESKTSMLLVSTHC
jgi:hypothetical protein